MRQTVFAALMLFPILALGAGWGYYTLNDEGEWERISRYELDLAVPAADGSGDDRRVMILYNPSAKKPPAGNARNWLPGVGTDLPETVEQTE